MLNLIIFYFAAIIAVGGAVMMIIQRNPVASVLYMVVSLVAQAILYVQLSALFVGALLIIIYTGAILVLFLFVIMLLNLRGEHFGGKQSVMGRASKVVISVILLVEFAAIFKQLALSQKVGSQLASVPEDFGSVEMVASHLFKEYLYPFELTSILLLVAIVGAVVIAKKDKTDTHGDA
ncbi:MAG: NADH-quinone oxidoreductase subunit J [candidate division Zixibacteria bacterium HGW-Zixibacteria-1]|nr:MAG: NADH-quinone oxidoreductase subunit J [candidate division Zixibacteria bacterium HGW-Zixibacteria-1]